MTHWICQKFFACGALYLVVPYFLLFFSPAAGFPHVPVTHLCAHWRIVKPGSKPLRELTRLHSQWHVFMPTDALLFPVTPHWHVFVPTRVPLCPVTRPYAYWRVFMPTSALSCPLTCLNAHWRAFMPSDTPLCVLTRLNAHWCVFMPVDLPQCPLACPYALWLTQNLE